MIVRKEKSKGIVIWVCLLALIMFAACSSLVAKMKAPMSEASESVDCIEIDMSQADGCKNVTVSMDTDARMFEVGSYLKFEDVDFSIGFSKFKLLYAAEFLSHAELRLGAPDGAIIGEISMDRSGGSSSFVTAEGTLNNNVAKGKQDVYLVMKDGKAGIKKMIVKN